MCLKIKKQLDIFVLKNVYHINLYDFIKKTVFINVNFRNVKMSSGEDEPSPKKKMKVLKLKGGVMTVRYVGYRSRGDKEMIVELEFCFDSDPLNPKIVGEYLFTFFCLLNNDLLMTFVTLLPIM